MSATDELQADMEPSTFWELNGQNRWGQYLSDIEKDVILRTLDRFPNPGRAIEIGCDGGKWSTLLASLGWEMTCVDIDADALRVCQSRIPHAETILADADSHGYSVPQETYDLVLAIQLPPAEREWFALEAARLLKPGGFVVFDVINASSYRAWLSMLRSKSRNDEMFYVYRFADVRKAYEDAGFTFHETIGHAWAPFSRDSNSKLIPLAAGVEKILGLRRTSRYAPWIISVAEKEAATMGPQLRDNASANVDESEAVRCES